jgi:23S rRNA pseudouridine1911/1915/1917 synthase
MSPPSIRVVIAADPPPRLDRALARDVPAEAHLSRSRLARLIACGAVSRGGTPVTDPTARALVDDAYDIVLAEEAAPEMTPAPIALTVVHEDADVAVIDKPAGLVVHPGPGNAEGTLVQALLHRYGAAVEQVGDAARPGIVHRIDKDTSGLLVVARTVRAHHALSRQFAEHTVERRYLAFCHGMPDMGDPRLRGVTGVAEEPGGFRVATHLARHRTDRQRQAVSARGRHAVTHVRLLRRFGAAALVECRLDTGRTHQIRVHMSHVGHPLIGDQVYGRRRRMPQAAPGAETANGLRRQALHAAALGFYHPDGRMLRFESALPPDLAQLLEALSR